MFIFFRTLLDSLYIAPINVRRMVDPRYKILKVMIETGNVKTFAEVFNVIPKTVVANDLGINYVRFTQKVKRPEEFMVKDLIKLSSLMEAEGQLITNVVLKDIEGRRSPKKKKL